MKASIEWLEEYSDIDVNSAELGDILTMTGSKVETINETGENIKNVVVGKICFIEKHPDADKLVITQVDVGNEKIQIVTGARNINVGDVVPVAKEGAILPDGKIIKKGKLRGVDSCGMMCSIGELGLTKADFPEQIEDGIMILGEKYEKDLGKNIVDVLDIRESIIDFEITPNRQDCFSIEGIGREVAVSLNKEFKNPRKNLNNINIKKVEQIEGLSAKIKDPDLCYRYIARVVKNVKIGESPDWMKKRLKACGIRSINNIVDITNYVMLELGQPMHAFDINSIKSKEIIVRRAKLGEEITTLDGIKRKLDEDMLVIADSQKPIAIAGVMGGENSEIEDNTKTVVFESAVFYGGSIRKTSRKLALRTEASTRYEKGLSQENALRAVNRAVELVKLLQIGEEVEEIIDEYPTKQETAKIELNSEKINKLLGLNVPKQEMMSILKKLEMTIVEENGKTYIIPPFFRQDIEQLADLAEEILRFYGYDKLESTLVKANTTIGLKNKEQKIEDKIRSVMINNGLSEIYTFSFTNYNELKKLCLNDDNELILQAIKVQNPLNEDYTIMRTTTVPSMLQILSNNFNKKNEEVRLFDISRKYKNVNNKIEKEELPEEDIVLTIGMYGDNIDFFRLKGIVENVLEISELNKYDIIKEKNNSIYHPGICANLKVGNDIFATFGEVHPKVIMNYGINQKVYIAEININKITKYAKVNKKYQPIPKFPALERDIAIVVDENVEVGTIEKIIEKKSNKMLEELKLFDVYRSDKLGNNKKSVAYNLKFRIKDRTLKDEEVNTVMKNILEQLEKELNAELRK